MLRKSTLILLVIFLLVVVGCGGKKSDQITIAVIPKGTTHSFWQNVHAGAVKASKELGVEGRHDI